MPGSLSCLAFLRASCVPEHLGTELRQILLDAALVLPCELTEAEREDLFDLIATFAGLPVHVTARGFDLRRNHANILTEPVEEDPPPAPGGMVIAVRAPGAGRRRLEASLLLRRLRDAVLSAAATPARGERIADIATWAEHVADSPSTALRFAAAAHAAYLAAPGATDADLVLEGLTELVAWLFRGIDPRVAEWVLARALPSKNAERLVSTEAAILGETAALQRAFAAGLIEHLPDEDDSLDLRRPLAVLREPADMPAGVDLQAITARLKGKLHPQAYGVIDRWLRARPRPLRLGAPLRRHDFTGREDTLSRLVSLFEPANEIRTAVLYGMAGLGKSAAATEVCERLSDRLETVWLTFMDGPPSAWRRVAEALGMDSKLLLDERKVEDRPAWLRAVHARMAERDALIVVDDADRVPEADLPGWLPKGPGSCAVLVLSTRAERVLQRDNDAISVQLRPLNAEEARALLRRKVTGIDERAGEGEADALLRMLGGHPSAIGWAAALLEKRSLEEVTALVEQGTDVLRGLVRHAVESLDPEERAVVEALAVAAPSGSPRGLIARMIEGEEEGAGEIGPVLQRLADRAVVELNTSTVKLYGVVQIAIESEMAAERRRDLEERHARAVDAVMEVARKTDDEEGRDEAYEDLVLALERMTERCKAADVQAAVLCSNLAFELQRYPRGSLGASLGLVVAVYDEILGVLTREEHPEDWARVKHNLGDALRETPAGDRAGNILRALAAFQDALTIYEPRAHPDEWASVQNSIGIALCQLPAGELADNRLRALQAYEAALTVYSREQHPKSWAMVQNNIGSLHLNLSSGDRVEDLRRAVRAYEEVMEVCAMEKLPRNWAIAQHNLGQALLGLAELEEGDGVRRAISALEAALTVRALDTVPSEWANTHSALGNAFAMLHAGDRAVNLQRALGAYKEALRVFTREAFPWQWARTQYFVARALLAMPSGSRRQNLQAAITALQGALSVWTQAAFPRDHANVQAELGKTLAELAALGPTTNPPPPLTGR